MMHVHLPTQVNAFELSKKTDLEHQLTPAQQFFPPGLKDGIITALTDANYTNKNYNNIRWNTLESEEMTKVRTITRKYKSLDVIEFSTQTLALLGQNFHGSDSKVDYRLSIKGRMIRKKTGEGRERYRIGYGSDRREEV